VHWQFVFSWIAGTFPAIPEGGLRGPEDRIASWVVGGENVHGGVAIPRARCGCHRWHVVAARRCRRGGALGGHRGWPTAARCSPSGSVPAAGSVCHGACRPVAHPALREVLGLRPETDNGGSTGRASRKGDQARFVD